MCSISYLFVATVYCWKIYSIKFTWLLKDWLAQQNWWDNTSERPVLNKSRIYIVYTGMSKVMADSAAMGQSTASGLLYHMQIQYFSL